MRRAKFEIVGGQCDSEVRTLIAKLATETQALLVVTKEASQASLDLIDTPGDASAVSLIDRVHDVVTQVHSLHKCAHSLWMVMGCPRDVTS
jgi:hypothetical protein